MKFNIYLVILIILVSACSSDNSVEEGGMEQETNLEVLDYNPKESYTSEEVTIVTTGIDSTVALEAFISGVNAQIVKIANDDIIVRVPSQAVSGELMLKAGQTEINVGEVQIKKEEDVLYGEYIGENQYGEDTWMAYEIDLDNATAANLLYEAKGYDQVGSLYFSNKTNTFFNGYCVQCGSVGGGCHCSYVFTNLDNDLSSSVTICTDLECNESFRLKSYNNGKAIYEYYRSDYYSDSHSLKSLDFSTMQTTTLRDYIQNPVVPIPSSSLYIHERNELVAFDNAYKVISLNDFTTENFEYPGVNLTSLYLDTTGRMFAVNNMNTIVEIDSNNGEILEEIYTWNENLEFLQYSESTGRFFWVDHTTGVTIVNIFNPENQIRTEIIMDEYIRKLFIDN